MGVVDEDSLVQVLGQQLQMDTREIDPHETPSELLRLLPRELAAGYSVYPLELKAGGRLVVATDRPLSPAAAREIERQIERPLEICLTTSSDLAFAVQRGYERLEMSGPGKGARSRLGEVLARRGYITPQQLREALRKQRRSYVRLGELLVEDGVLSREQLGEALCAHSGEGVGWLGDFLVRSGILSLAQLERALERQKQRFRRLGDVVVEMKLVRADVLRRVLTEVNA